MRKKLNKLECCNSLHLLCSFDGCDVKTKEENANDDVECM